MGEYHVYWSGSFRVLARSYEDAMERAEKYRLAASGEGDDVKQVMAEENIQEPIITFSGLPEYLMEGTHRNVYDGPIWREEEEEEAQEMIGLLREDVDRIRHLAEFTGRVEGEVAEWAIRLAYALMKRDELKLYLSLPVDDY